MDISPAEFIRNHGLKAGEPDEVGLSADRLERINKVMQEHVDQQRYAGIITMLTRRGKVIHFQKCGKMDLEADKDMQFDTIFRIYSMTKPITSIALMMLYEEACFHIDDPVSRFIPAFKDLKVFLRKKENGFELEDLTRPMTIRHILTHTSGFTYGFDENSPVDSMYRKALILNPDSTLHEMTEKLKDIPLVHQPGTNWHYGISTDIAGHLVEIISGLSFDEFLKKRIFEPLGMTDTGFYTPSRDLPRLSAVYKSSENGGLELADSPEKSRFSKPVRFFSGGGGLVSTSTDYMKFAQMLLNKGQFNGIQLLGRKTLEYMTMNHLPDGISPFENNNEGFGLGFSVRLNEAKAGTLGSKGMFGWGGAANTDFWVDPKEEMAGLFMTQFMPNGFYSAGRDFRVLVYQSIVD